MWLLINLPWFNAVQWVSQPPINPISSVTSHWLQNKGHTSKPGFKAQIHLLTIPASTSSLSEPLVPTKEVCSPLSKHITTSLSEMPITPVLSIQRTKSSSVSSSHLWSFFLPLALTGPSITYILSCPNPVSWPPSNWDESISMQRPKVPNYCSLSLVNNAQD